jgi:hypothetical protein
LNESSSELVTDQTFQRYVRSLLTNPQELVTAATIAGLVIYQLVWSFNFSFYRYFSVQPDEVGITYVVLLAQSAIVLVLAGSYGLLVSMLFGRTLFWRHVAETLVLTLLLLGLLLTDFFYVGPSWQVVIVFGGLPFLVPASRYLTRIAQPSVRKISGSFARFLLGVSLILCALYLLSVPVQQGQHIAERVADGEGISAPLQRFTGVKAYPLTRVAWLERGENIPKRESGYRYFGQANGITVLFDPTTQIVYRVPSSSIVIVGRLERPTHIR